MQGSDSEWQSSGYYSSSALTASQDLTVCPVVVSELITMYVCLDAQLTGGTQEQASGKKRDSDSKTERIAAHVKFLSSGEPLF